MGFCEPLRISCDKKKKNIEGRGKGAVVLYSFLDATLQHRFSVCPYKHIRSSVRFKGSEKGRGPFLY